jgi:Na+:H+ antiporter, NhaC family
MSVGDASVGPPTDAPTAGRDPSLVDAVLPLVLLAVLIGGSIALFGLDALDGPIQVALVLCAMAASLIAMKNGHSWDDVERATKASIASVTTAIFILLAVGALIGVWNLSGTIPTLVYYGIQVLSPGWYYAAAALICGVVSLSIGSSWTTVGTIGVGLVGIAVALDVSTVITAGAVVSGAYLGDKLSPLSETTVLTSQLAGVDVYEHVKRQAWTSLPAFGLAFVAFLVLAVVRGTDSHTVPETVELHALDDVYNITPLNLLPLVLLAFLSLRKVPAALALMASALFAGVCGAFLQHDIVTDFGGGGGPVVASIKGVWQAMATGFQMDSGVSEVDRLVSRGGMASLLLTIWLIIGAVSFGALLEEFGMIARLVDPLISAAKTTGRLFATVFACAFGLNLVAGDQYIALVLPTKVFRAEFAKRRLAPTNLSRLCADSGTVTSPLVPWNSCGAFMGAVLGVSALQYLPYALFNIFSPALSVLYGFTGFRIEHLPAPPDSTAAEAAPAKEPR